MFTVQNISKKKIKTPKLISMIYMYTAKFKKKKNTYMLPFLILQFYHSIPTRQKLGLEHSELDWKTYHMSEILKKDDQLSTSCRRFQTEKGQLVQSIHCSQPRESVLDGRSALLFKNSPEIPDTDYYLFIFLVNLLLWKKTYTQHAQNAL